MLLYVKIRTDPHAESIIFAEIKPFTIKGIYGHWEALDHMTNM